MTNNLVLSLSGNDIFSGGGLTADLATYTVNGLHGFVAVTCLTSLTAEGFQVLAISPDIFQQELDSLKDVVFSGIKIGLLPNTELAQLALSFVKEHADIPVVLDPVLVCKEKHDVSVTALRDELIAFFPYVTIVTPNLMEAEILTGQTIKKLDDMKLAAQKLHELGAKNVIVKGGNRFSKDLAIDIFYNGEAFSVFEKPVSEKNNIGAGCTFASSIASHLVKGETVLDSVSLAKEFVYQAIQASNKYGVVQNYDK